MPDKIVPNPDMEQALRAGDIQTEDAPADAPYEPLYRIVGDTKIPVAKSMGHLWRSRRDNARQARDQAEEAWKEAIRYYNNDQMGHRQADQLGSGNKYVSKRLNDAWSETENVVFSNVCTMLPILYAKNPSPEITPTQQGMEPFAAASERLLSALSNMKEAPGINLKPKARRAIVIALLTNKAWLELGWTFKDASSEAAMKELDDLGKELAAAKNTREIKEIEGKLQALEKQIDVLSPEGPFAKVVLPFNVIVDPESVEADGSDAKWMMVADYLPTEYVQARFMKEEDGQWKSIYEPTHIMRLKDGNTDNGVEDDVVNFTLALSPDKKTSTMYGYDDTHVFEKSQLTKVWYVWDKTTRRVYMFHDKDWAWPIWVWSDPYHLLNFFPLYPLWFHESVDNNNPKGEVTYYLDQQDAINEINDEIRRSRRWAKRNVFFNKNAVNRDDVENVLKGPDGTARGIDIPQGMKLTEVIGTLPPPAVQFAQLFDTSQRFQAIQRITGINDVLRGMGFKTNTTNDQAGSQMNFSTIRLDEKTDLIEDWLGSFYYGLLQLCVQFMPEEQVRLLLGENSNGWRNMQTEELRIAARLQIVGGSSDKPTSKIKKQEALQLGQVLGQFVKASPAVVLIMLRVFEKAFDEIVITREDWEYIMQTTQANMQKAGAGPGQPQEQGQPTNEQAPAKEQLVSALRNLPPQKKQQIEAQVQAGVSPQQAIKSVVTNQA